MDELGVEGLVNRVFPGPPAGHVTRDFILVINNNLGPVFHYFRDTATYSLKLSIKICGQTAADGDMVTIDSL